MAKLIDKDMYSETIKKVIDKEITPKEATEYLKITYRQVRRLITTFKEKGDIAFVHKNAGNLITTKKFQLNIK